MPWDYAEARLVTCGVISTANDKVAAFHDLAAGLGRDVREGFLNNVDVADRLTQLADAMA
jgi:NADPH-dependent curcumin reductase CurA